MTVMHSAAPDRARPRVLALVLAAALLLLLGLPALAPAPAGAVPPSSVEVSDTTGSVDPELLESRLSEVDFRREVRLVVLVLDVTEHGASVEEDTALNDAVLDSARTDHPALLSEDGKHWADGTVLLALDPDGRFLGTYAGEDVKLSDSGFEEVQDAMRSPARDGDWDEAIEEAARKYAAVLDRPWWRDPELLFVPLLGLVAAPFVAVFLLSRRATAHRHVFRALPRHDAVLAQREVTDAAARTLPEHSPYARAAVHEHERFEADLAEAAWLRAELPEPVQRGFTWGMRRRDRALAARFEEVVDRLDGADDAILAAADLLLRRRGWRAAWEQELRPLRDSLDALAELREEWEEMSEPEQWAADRLLYLGDGIAEEIETLTARLEADTIDPDSALAELDTLTRELSAAAAELTGLRMEILADDEEEREVLRGSLAAPRGEEYETLRGLRRALEHPDDAASEVPFQQLSPVVWYVDWHHRSSTALEVHREPSGGGGSFSGYSGGGFSGAGSSSRF